MKKALGTIMAAGLLTLGATGTAYATGTDPAAGSGDKPVTVHDHARGRHPGVRREAIRVAADAAASTIGVDVSEIKAAVKGGQTVGEFAESKGVSAQSVVDAIVSALNDRIDQAVADGKIPAERAAKVEERVPGFADRLVHSVPERFRTRTPAPSQG